MLILALFSKDKLSVQLGDHLVLLLDYELEFAEELFLLFEGAGVALGQASQLCRLFVPENELIEN